MVSVRFGSVVALVSAVLGVLCASGSARAEGGHSHLLYTFVTNQAGFDTGLSLSNTSLDTLGTATHSGTCTFTFFGTNAPSAVTTPVLAAGATHTLLASSAAPNFQGYVIADCNFPFAHGIGFISDLGARNLAFGYLALVLPPRRLPAAEGLNN